MLPEYRNCGIGTHSLFKIIQIARRAQRKEFRLITFKKWNHLAQRLYDKTMQIAEYYKNDYDCEYAIKEGKAMIFSSNLFDKRVKKWNNKFVNLIADKDLNEKSIKKLKEDKII